MSSIAENLLSNESIVHESKKHWIAPVRDSAYAVLMIVGFFVLNFIQPGSDTGLIGLIATLIGLAKWIVLIGGGAWIAYNIVVWQTAEFAVTSVRVLRYEGLLQRRSSETLLSAVSDVKLHIGFLGKSLGYGDLRIFTQSGAAGADTFRSITQAAEFRNAMMNIKISEQTGLRAAQAAKAQAATAPVAPIAVAAPAAAPVRASADDSAARLIKLAELRDRGVISPEEFEAKKAEILARM